MNLFKNFPKIKLKLLLHKSSVATKNGKRQGITLFVHKESPSCAATRLVSENSIRDSVNNKKSIVKKYFFRLITKKFIKPPKNFLYIIYVEKMKI